MNYYELLEVSEKASDEVIEKAYKTLAKKYHPDLHVEQDKKISEQKMKEINVAYEILSDKAKREEYDENLQFERAKVKVEEKYKHADIENNKPKPNVNNNSYNNINSNLQEELKNKEKEIMQEFERKTREKYQERYYDNLRSLGYKIKYKMSWKSKLDILIIIAMIIFIGYLLWKIPFTNKFFVNIYESNEIVKIIVDIIINVFKVIFTFIGDLFNKLIMLFQKK